MLGPEHLQVVPPVVRGRHSSLELELLAEMELAGKTEFGGYFLD